MFKGSNTIVCVLLVSNSQGFCLAAPGDHEGAARVIAPRRDNTRFDPDYNMMPQCFAQQLIKSNLKFEARATAVSVAMSPCYLGGRYRSRLHPRSQKCAGDWACEIYLRQTGVICFSWRQRSWSCDMFKSWISDAHCPFQSKWQVLHNYDISRASSCRFVFRWDRLLDEGLAFVQAGVPSCPDDVTLRSCANFKCGVADLNK